MWEQVSTRRPNAWSIAFNEFGGSGGDPHPTVDHSEVTGLDFVHPCLATKLEKVILAENFLENLVVIRERVAGATDFMKAVRHACLDYESV
jgi:hypothetical protein